MFEKYLQEIGLNEKEASIYIALLQVDNASVIEIANKTKINRSTVYVVLEGLIKKGLVSEIPVGKKVHYRAESPERLETFVEGQRILLEERSKKLKDIIPQIKGIQRASGERPVVKYFEGHESTLGNYLSLFTSKDKGGVGYFLYNKDLIDEIFSQDEISSIGKIRLGKGIVGQSLYTSKKVTRPSGEVSKRIKINGEKYPLYCDISIYEDRMQIVTMGKSVSTVFIQSRDIVETFKSLFRLAFDNIRAKE